MGGENSMPEKKKVAIITIYSRLNYGNRLQNYAVQEILKNINVEKIFRNLDYLGKRLILNSK